MTATNFEEYFESQHTKFRNLFIFQKLSLQFYDIFLTWLTILYIFEEE